MFRAFVIAGVAGVALLLATATPAQACRGWGYNSGCYSAPCCNPGYSYAAPSYSYAPSTYDGGYYATPSYYYAPSYDSSGYYYSCPSYSYHGWGGHGWRRWRGW
jgi:hypothetical protein